ncbi:hypothetical protein SLS60_002140 [Paraconiothyrium brasiliense]|uniref:Uncharacterized protein n=1 Tax=Paraconiothyrium brasiliense TaxID=300254 RepID=A0ABR3S1A9_9PLEO
MPPHSTQLRIQGMRPAPTPPVMETFIMSFLIHRQSLTPLKPATVAHMPRFFKSCESAGPRLTSFRTFGEDCIIEFLPSTSNAIMVAIPIRNTISAPFTNKAKLVSETLDVIMTSECESTVDIGVNQEKIIMSTAGPGEDEPKLFGWWDVLVFELTKAKERRFFYRMHVMDGGEGEIPQDITELGATHGIQL